MVKYKILIMFVLVLVIVFGCSVSFAENNDTYELEQILISIGSNTQVVGWQQGRYTTYAQFPISQQQFITLTNGTSFVTLNVQYQRLANSVWSDSTSTYFIQISADNMHNGNLQYNALTDGIHLLYYESGTNYYCKLVFLIAPRIENDIEITERVSSFGYVIINNSTPSFDLGYNQGFNEGLEQGYDHGFNDGLAENPFEINPVLVIFNSVEQMLNVKILGSLSLADIITGFIGILFVIWFLKMFRGG